MIMKQLKILFIVVFLLTSIVSCAPDLSDINLSGCMKDCNQVAKDCLSSADEKIVLCAPDDDQCRLLVIRESETCLTTCLDCISICVEDLENTLKK